MSDPTAGGTGDAGGASNPPTTPGTPPPPPPPPTGGSLSQEQVDEILGRRVAEAQRQATKSLVKDLGFERVEDAKAALEAAKAAERAQMTEAQRLQAEAAEAKRDAETMKEALAFERHSLSVERALAKAGAQGDTARLVRLVDSEVGSDAAAVETAVGKLKTDFPALFGAGTPSLSSTQGVGGGSPGRTTNPNSNPLDVGKAKAEAYEKAHQRTGF